MRVADLIAQILVDHGIKHVFMVTGGAAMHLNDALGKHKDLEYICCHHEQSCAMATEAYARVKNELGVTLVTSGPGGTNTISGICGSWTDSVPHLILTGQVFSSQTIGDSGWRSNLPLGYRCERLICSALLVLVPLSFHRGVFSVFASPKVTTTVRSSGVSTEVTPSNFVSCAQPPSGWVQYS